MALKRLSLLMLISMLSAMQFITKADVLITSIKDKNITCDYLIIAPDVFKADAIRLGEHRNSFKGDDVENAHVVLLDSVYSGFSVSDTLQKHEIIWYGLKWMYENWKEPFKYLVLMGDDSLIYNPVDSSVSSFGRMPTFIEGLDFNAGFLSFKLSDDWYTTLLCQTPTINTDSLFATPVIIGRIPCETAQQCNLFIDKVMGFDLHSPNGPWRNRALLCADDEFEGSSWDYINHYLATENIAYNYLHNYFVSKCYLTSFPFDTVGFKPDATNYFFNQINANILWVVYSGHANCAVLSHECFLTTANLPMFKNQDTPIIFLSFSCLNGSFHVPFSNSMCKQFLLKPNGGCIMYIASPTVEFPSISSFSLKIFEVLQSNPGWSIGKVIYAAKKNFINKRLYYNYSVLGDPALTLSHNNAPLNIKLKPDIGNPTAIKCSILSPQNFSGTHLSTFTILDTISINNGGPYITNYINDKPFANAGDTFTSSFEIPIPKEAYNKKVRFISYVWNDQYDGRVDTILTLDAAGIPHGNKDFGQSKSFYMKLTRNLLSITYNKNIGDQLTELAIFNIRGQQVFSQKYNTYKNVITIDLNKYNMPTGKYMIQIKTKGFYLNKPLIYIK